MPAGAAGHFSSSPLQPSLSWKGFLPSLPPQPPLSFIAARLLFCCCCLVPSYNCFPPGPRASSFSPTALCKGFLAAGYVRALDLEVLMRLVMRGPRAWALPRFLPAAPQLQPAFRLLRLALGRGTPRASPCSSYHGDCHAKPPPLALFLPSFTPPIPPSSPAAEQVVWQCERFPCRGRAGRGRGAPAVRHSLRAATLPPPCAPPGAAAPGKGSGLLLRPEGRGQLG